MQIRSSWVRALCGALTFYSLSSMVPASVDAQRSIKIQGVRPEVHLGLGWRGGVGVGFRVDIPIVPDGFIDGVNDEFALSPGAELWFWDLDDHDHGDESNIIVAPLIAPQWNFYLNNEWSLFPELGLALVFGDRHHHHGRNADHGGHDDGFDLDFFLGLGARYHFSTRNSFVMRLAWPFGLQLGITF